MRTARGGAIGLPLKKLGAIESLRFQNLKTAVRQHQIFRRVSFKLVVSNKYGQQTGAIEPNFPKAVVSDNFGAVEPLRFPKLGTAVRFDSTTFCKMVCVYDPLQIRTTHMGAVP